MDAKQNIVYELNEEQYLELLSKNPLTVRWGYMHQVSKDAPISDFFNLQVGSADKDNTALLDIINKHGNNIRISAPDLKNDALYNYLVQKSNIVRNNLKGKKEYITPQIIHDFLKRCCHCQVYTCIGRNRAAHTARAYISVLEAAVTEGHTRT